MSPRLGLWLAAASSAWAACTPALDWRETRPEGSQVLLMYPCRPASHARRVALAGTQVEMTMVACSAGDTVYALTYADLGDPARVGPALEELGRSLQGSVRSSAPAASQPVTVPGMTPHPQAAQWRVSGRLPDDRQVEEWAVVFSRGSRVYQATMLGPRLDAEAQETFFGALRVGP